MTHLLDTSALLAHYLAESGADRVQALFEDDTVVAGASILSLYEFELRLHQLGVDVATAPQSWAVTVPCSMKLWTWTKPCGVKQSVCEPARPLTSLRWMF